MSSSNLPGLLCRTIIWMVLLPVSTLSWWAWEEVKTVITGTMNPFNHWGIQTLTGVLIAMVAEAIGRMTYSRISLRYKWYTAPKTKLSFRNVNEALLNNQDQALLDAINEEPWCYLISSRRSWGKLHCISSVRRDRRQSYIGISMRGEDAEIHICEEETCKIGRNRSGITHLPVSYTHLTLPTKRIV